MTTRGYSATKDQLQQRLRRIEGQVRGVQGMVDDDRYCIDVLTQISAIQAALDKVALGLLDDHARHCVLGADADDQADKTDELMAAVGRLLRRVEGQVRGVERMVEEDRYCIDVLTQISAIQAALDKVALGLLDGHARHCVVGAADSDLTDERTAELMNAVGRLMRRG